MAQQIQPHLMAPPQAVGTGKSIVGWALGIVLGAMLLVLVTGVGVAVLVPMLNSAKQQASSADTFSAQDSPAWPERLRGTKYYQQLTRTFLLLDQDTGLPEMLKTITVADIGNRLIVVGGNGQEGGMKVSYDGKELVVMGEMAVDGMQNITVTETGALDKVDAASMKYSAMLSPEARTTAETLCKWYYPGKDFSTVEFSDSKDLSKEGFHALGTTSDGKTVEAVGMASYDDLSSIIAYSVDGKLAKLMYTKFDSRDRMLGKQ
jgi:hypothetical protein